MRLCRFNDDRIGVVRGDNVHDVTAILDQLPAARYPFPQHDVLIQNLEKLRPAMEKLADAAKPVQANTVKFRSPVANPTKIIGTPVNYAKHVAEAKADPAFAGYLAGTDKTITEQGLFLKANSALVGPGDGVAIKMPDRRTDHEAELGVVIGRTCVDVKEEDALTYVAGYSMAIDMVIRGPEDRSFRKSLDTFAVLGPWLVTADEYGSPENRNFALTVNGQPRQKANTSDMILNVKRQIAWAASFYTLHPGDIIMSGTPEGVGPVKPGDTMHFEFDGIGAMDIAVR